MLRYNRNKILKLKTFRWRSPFPGSYPTRLYAVGLNYEYLGKPTPEAWKRLIRKKNKNDRFPFFIEFDRGGIIRRTSRHSEGIKVSPATLTYYCVPSEDLDYLPLGLYPSFKPLQLREGTVYVSQFHRAKYSQLSAQAWYTIARRRIRMNFRDKFFVTPDNPPVQGEEPTVEDGTMDRLFRQLVKTTQAELPPEPPRFAVNREMGRFGVGWGEAPITPILDAFLGPAPTETTQVPPTLNTLTWANEVQVPPIVDNPLGQAANNWIPDAAHDRWVQRHLETLGVRQTEEG